VRRAIVISVILLAMLVLVACGKDGALGEDDEAAAPAPATTATATIPPRSSRDGCRAVPPPVPSQSPERSRSLMRLDPRRNHVAVVRTNCGTIRILLAVQRSPKTTASFAGLVRGRYFDGLPFHRIAKPGGNDYVIQGGDPLGTGNGGPGYSVVEAPGPKTRYVRGVVAMAKAADEAPGTSGSQFFVVTARTTPLAPEYAVLGRVVAGDGVVSRIAAVPADPVSEMPLDPVVIESIRIERR